MVLKVPPLFCKFIPGLLPTIFKLGDINPGWYVAKSSVPIPTLLKTDQHPFTQYAIFYYFISVKLNLYFLQLIWLIINKSLSPSCINQLPLVPST